jgi:glycine cleavage system T protein (aminomethyltransferase)
VRTEASGLLKTPLHDVIRRSGARCVDFAGWEMPVQFESVIEEHMAVRTRAGLFDVSHMGEIEVAGEGALSFLEEVTPNHVGRLEEGQAQYSALLTERATFVDDILVHRRGRERFLLCVNASNTRKDFEHLQRQTSGRNLHLEDVSSRFAQLALQGPRAVSILGRVAGGAVAGIPSYHFIEGSLAGAPALISRTGYTGEDGFEIYLAPGDAEKVWLALLEEGRTEGIAPCGLGARDTLRLEARLPLYGNDIDETVTPLEAGLSFIVKLEKGTFLGAEVLRAQKERGVARTLAGFEMTGRGIARHGYPLRVEGRDAGQVTSGSYAPFLKKNIGLGYVPARLAVPGQEIEIVIRGSSIPARIVKTPFYKRQA